MADILLSQVADLKRMTRVSLTSHAPHTGGSKHAWNHRAAKNVRIYASHMSSAYLWCTCRYARISCTMLEIVRRLGVAKPYHQKTHIQLQDSVHFITCQEQPCHRLALKNTFLDACWPSARLEKHMYCVHTKVPSSLCFWGSFSSAAPLVEASGGGGSPCSRTYRSQRHRAAEALFAIEDMCAMKHLTRSLLPYCCIQLTL